MSKALVCVVTGASRGVGRGAALAMGTAGATVYVMGRSVKEGNAPLPGIVAAPFWQKPLAMTSLLDLGLRSSYVACHQGADLLIAARVCAAEPDKYGYSIGTAETCSS